MNDQDNSELKELKNEIQNMSLLKKTPLLISYVTEKIIDKTVPNIILNNSSRIGNFLFNSSAYFFTMIFPALYVYQRDKNEYAEDDDLIYKEKS